MSCLLSFEYIYFVVACTLLQCRGLPGTFLFIAVWLAFCVLDYVYILHQKMKLFSFFFELHLHKYGGWKEKLILQCARVVICRCKILDARLTKSFSGRFQGQNRLFLRGRWVMIRNFRWNECTYTSRAAVCACTQFKFKAI